MPEDFAAVVFPQVYPYVTSPYIVCKDLTKCYSLLENVVDGIFLFSPESYEPEIIAAVKGWYSKTGRHAYACGPLLPSASKATAKANELTQASKADEVVTLLDDTLKASGQRSLLYVSILLAYFRDQSLTRTRFVDFVRIHVLADQVSGEGLGLPRRRDGTEHPLCASPSPSPLN